MYCALLCVLEYSTVVYNCSFFQVFNSLTPKYNNYIRLSYNIPNKRCCRFINTRIIFLDDSVKRGTFTVCINTCLSYEKHGGTLIKRRIPICAVKFVYEKYLYYLPPLTRRYLYGVVRCERFCTSLYF